MALIIGGNLVDRLPAAPAVPADVGRAAEPRALPRRCSSRASVLVLVAIAVIALLAAGLSAQGNWATWQLWLHGGSFGVTGSAVPPGHLVLRLGLPGLPAAARLRLHRDHLRAHPVGRRALPVRRDPAADARAEGHARRAPAPDGAGVRLHGAQGDRLLARPLRPGVLQPQQVHRRVLHRRARRRCRRGRSCSGSRSIIAAGLLASLWLRSTLLPASRFVSMLVLSILISGIYPAILQQVSVKPNASIEGSARTSSATSRRREQAYGIVDQAQQRATT